MPNLCLRLAVAFAAAVCPVLADTLQPLGDEFGHAASQARWSNLQEVERWGANQLEAWDVNTTTPGQMRMMPYTSQWYQNLRGVLIFKEITGDFVCTTRVRIRSRHNPANPDEVPNRSFSLAGIFAHAPRGADYQGAPLPYTTDSVYPPASYGSTWAPGTENYIFAAFGSAGNPGTRQYEIKSTRNSNSQLYYNNLGVPATANNNEIELQMIRVGGTVVVLRRHPAAGGGWANWIVENRYPNPSHSFPVWGSTLQVGITTYTDYQSVGGSYGTTAQRVWHHNYTQLVTGQNIYGGPAHQPDLIADVDYVRYERPNAAVTEVALQGLTTTFAAGSAQNLPGTGVGALLGDNANTPLGAVAFSAASYAVNEQAGSVSLTVTRSGSSLNRALSLTYATTSGSAGTGNDFTASNGTLSWAADDVASKVIQVPLNVADSLAEGPESFTVTLSSLDGPATFAASQPTITATVNLADAPLDQWRLDQFGANANNANALPLADFDLDGLSNLLEYALGSSPTAPSATAMPSGAMSSNRLRITFTRNTSTTALNWLVEGSSTLQPGSWTVLATKLGSAAWTSVPGATVNENGAGLVIVTDTEDTTSSARRFLRLRVEAP